VGQNYRNKGRFDKAIVKIERRSFVALHDRLRPCGDDVVRSNFDVAYRFHSLIDFVVDREASEASAPRGQVQWKHDPSIQKHHGCQYTVRFIAAVVLVVVVVVAAAVVVIFRSSLQSFATST